MKVTLKQIGQNLIIMLDEKPYSKQIADKDEREKVKGWAKDLAAINDAVKQTKKQEADAKKLVKQIEEYFTVKAVAQKEVKAKLAKIEKGEKLPKEPVKKVEEKVAEVVKKVDKDTLQNELDAIEKRKAEIKKELDEHARTTAGVAPVRKRTGNES